VPRTYQTQCHRAIAIKRCETRGNRADRARHARRITGSKCPVSSARPDVHGHVCAMKRRTMRVCAESVRQEARRAPHTRHSRAVLQCVLDALLIEVGVRGGPRERQYRLAKMTTGVRDDSGEERAGTSILYGSLTGIAHRT
jgi:hypothetical protein